MLLAASTSGTTICSTVRDLWERGELSTLALDEVMRLDPCRGTNVSTSFSPTSSSQRSLRKSNSKRSPAKADPTKAWAFKLLGARAAELDREWSQMQTPTLTNFDAPQYPLAFQALWLGLTRTLFTAGHLPIDSAGGKHRNHRWTIARYYIDKALSAPAYKALGDGKVCAEVGDKHFLHAYFSTCAEMLAVDLKDPKADVLIDLVHPDWTDPRIKQAHFDLLVVGEVMEHIDRANVALATLVRLLKPGGTIVWTTPFLMQYHANPGDENRYSPTRVDALFDRAGLDTVKSDGVGNWLAVTLYLAGFGTDETHSSELDAPDRDGSRPYWIDVIAVGRKRTSALDSRAAPALPAPGEAPNPSWIPICCHLEHGPHGHYAKRYYKQLDATSFEEVAQPEARPPKVTSSGAWILDPNYTYNFDKALALAVLDLARGSSLLELGAGLGCYARSFTLHKTSYGLKSFLAIDGAANVAQLTHGLVVTRDLTRPFDLDIPMADWVLCLEVGEHIPVALTEPFVDNLAGKAKKGLIVSWSNNCQRGVGHVNCRSNDNVIKLFGARRFIYDENATETLRAATIWPYFKPTILVFQKAQNFLSADLRSRRPG